MKIVALSDQHGFLPDIPPCDLLIVAGDQIPDYPHHAQHRLGSGPQIDKQAQWWKYTWLPWRKTQPAKMCLVTWGNHDYYGQHLYNTVNSRVVFGEAGDTVAIVDGAFELDGVKFWLTPWSSQFRDWAFMATEEKLAEKYKSIPTDIDVLVSHQPPYGYGDGAVVYDMETKRTDSLGSRALLDAVLRVKPKVVVCGHIHGGYGKTVVPVPAWVPEPDAWEFTVYNVALVNEQYLMVNKPTVIEL